MSRARIEVGIHWKPTERDKARPRQERLPVRSREEKQDPHNQADNLYASLCF
jgi:hypothetical protein